LKPLDLLLFARHLPDRLLHARRREGAVARLRRAGHPHGVLFLCHGNVCRSPFAAEYFSMRMRATGTPALTVRSAGFVGPDRSAPAPAQDAARQFGVDLEAHRSAIVLPQDIDSNTIVVVMSAAQERTVRARFGVRDTHLLVLGDLDPVPIAKRTILDPWNGSADDFVTSYSRITRCVDALVSVLNPAP
jgi:protein-tyrosine-phosphatase